MGSRAIAMQRNAVTLRWVELGVRGQLDSQASLCLVKQFDNCSVRLSLCMGGAGDFVALERQASNWDS